MYVLYIHIRSGRASAGTCTGKHARTRVFTCRGTGKWTRCWTSTVVKVRRDEADRGVVGDRLVLLLELLVLVLRLDRGRGHGAGPGSAAAVRARRGLPGARAAADPVREQDRGRVPGHAVGGYVRGRGARQRAGPAAAVGHGAPARVGVSGRLAAGHRANGVPAPRPRRRLRRGAQPAAVQRPLPAHGAVGRHARRHC